MDANEHRFEHDSVARAVEILGDRWTFLILRESFFGVRRFSDFAANLRLSRQILSERLQRLVRFEILERRRYSQRPERHEYVLTKRGRALYGTIVALMSWGDDELADEGRAPLVLRHSLCGQDAKPAVVCSVCGEELRPEDVVPEPGPGAAGRTRKDVPASNLWGQPD